jgi:hypothetical protein
MSDSQQNYFVTFWHNGAEDNHLWFGNYNERSTEPRFNVFAYNIIQNSLGQNVADCFIKYNDFFLEAQNAGWGNYRIGKSNKQYLFKCVFHPSDYEMFIFGIPYTNKYFVHRSASYGSNIQTGEIPTWFRITTSLKGPNPI